MPYIQGFYYKQLIVKNFLKNIGKTIFLQTKAKKMFLMDDEDFSIERLSKIKIYDL